MDEGGGWTWVEVLFGGRLWIGVGVEGCWWFEVVVTELVSDGEWLRTWVGSCWQFGAVMTGLALEKRVDD